MKRWCRPTLPCLKVLFCLVLSASLFNAATPTGAATETPPAPIPAWAQLDQAALEAFTGLDPDEQEARRREALSILDVALTQTSAPGRLEALRRAVERAPGEPLVWLNLGETLRWMGNDPAARAALDSGRSLFPGTSGEHRRQCIRQYALNMGWLDFEAGRWSEAEAWGAKAREFNGGLDGLLVELLGMSARSMPRTTYFANQDGWRPVESNSNNRLSNRLWCMRHFNYLHHTAFEKVTFSDPPNLARHTREDPVNVQRFRDYGTICEASGWDDLAVQYYEMGRSAHPLGDGGWLQEHHRPHPGRNADGLRLPFWTGPGGFYVTGSLVAYAEYAAAMVQDPAQRDRQAFWVERLMDTATACKHRHPNLPRRYYWRAVAYAAMGKDKYALEELFTGRSLAQQLNLPVGTRFDVLEGHLRLLRKEYAKAKPLLEDAVRSRPNDAGSWADLGIIQAAEDRKADARHAFDMALSLDESLAQVWHNRGILSSREKKWQASLDDLRRAADLAPDDEQIRADLQRIQKHYQFLQTSGRTD